MKQRLKLLVRSSFTLVIVALMLSLSSSIMQSYPASADASTDSATQNNLCGSAYLSISNNPYGCGYAPPEPSYSSLQVNLAVAATAILIVCAVWFANRKYFATLNKKSSRRLAYATVLGIVLLAAAVIFANTVLFNAWNSNYWVSWSSAQVLAALVFLPSFAVLIVCSVKARQYKQRRLWIANLALIAAAVYLASLSITNVAGTPFTY